VWHDRVANSCAEVAVWRTVVSPELFADFEQVRSVYLSGCKLAQVVKLISAWYMPEHPCLQSGRQFYIVTPVWR